METSSLFYKYAVKFLQKTSRFWPDRLFLSFLFKIRVGYSPDLNNPKTFNEKLTWMKLYNRNPLYTTMADKFAVKEYVAKHIGKEYVVDNYIVAESWDDIDFESLPNQFVMKCTHDSGGAFVCRDKTTFDKESVRGKIEQNMHCNYFYHSREWPYKNIKPRIICDRFLDDHTGKELRDYKFWCFDGKPTYMYCTIKGENIYENFYDMNFEPVPINHGFSRHKPEFSQPHNFELMKKLAAELSRNIPFVRVDFFEVEEKVYFGEFTFFDWGGMRPFKENWDLKLGALIELPK